MTGHDFTEDGGKEDHVGLVVSGQGASGLDFRQGVAGEGDGGTGEEVADLGEGEFGGMGGEVDAVEVGG